MSLSNSQKKYLRKLSHKQSPVFQIGKQGLSENLVKQTAESLEARELIKINILQNSEEEVKEAAETIASSVHAEIVQTIGSTMVLYKESKNNKKIELPK
ncbi:ribosome assembly RNA-binding protein YhbY [Sinobaca sp. H24]|uniref:ribosome assembly RNA-binding protein YhbY n=1 Tax=Sinobaca sp. H24 TaxID=2923376 RepID=UPI00207A9420|nr:ribosome assembly RNA-binding protein YhbY [Sinobaca sp. H24]